MREIDYIANAIKAAEAAGIDALDFLEATLVMQAKTARLRAEDAPRIVECAQAIAEYVNGMAMAKTDEHDSFGEHPPIDVQQPVESAPITAPSEGTGAQMFRQILKRWEKFSS